MSDYFLIIIISIAVLGILLCTMLFTRILSINSASRLRQFRAKDEGLADLLNYAAVVEDGIILNKNGSLMAAFVYAGPDSASSTAAEKEDISFRINQALKGLGNGWMVHIDAVRHPSPRYPTADRNFFPSKIAAAIDEERRQYFEAQGTLYEGQFIVVFTYFPPILAEKKFTELMFDDDAAAPDRSKQQRMIIKKFDDDISGIENNISISMKMTRLRAEQQVQEDNSYKTIDHFLAWLHFCVTGKHHEIILPDNPMYIDSIIGGQELYTGVVPLIGENYIQIVAIDGFPSQSYPGILARLSELPIEYRWSTRFIFMDAHEAVSHYEKFRKKWKQKVRGFFDQVFNTGSTNIDLDAAAMVDDASKAISETNSGQVGQGYYTSLIVLMHNDRPQLESIARYVEKEINRLGFNARIESVNTMEAYLGSLPGHGVQNIRRPLMNTMNLADLMPTSSIWVGSETNPCPFYPPESPAMMQVVTHGSSPFRLNLHVGDVGHTLIIGPTGAGKSTLLAVMIAQNLRYPKMKVFSFDKGCSLEALTYALGGDHYSIGETDSNNDKNLSFAPLQLIKNRSDRAWAVEWVESLMSLNGIQISPAQRNEITAAIDNNASTQSYSLSDLSNTLQDEQMREVLKFYTIDGPMGYLLDATEDGLSLSNFSCFEIEELMNLDRKYCLPILMYLFRRIEKALDGSPAIVTLDEAWIMLGDDVFKAKIREWLKVFRKKNCSVVLATQSLSDASNSGILDVINESCLTKIYLPNVTAREEDTSAIYKRLGLNTRQIEIIATAIPKRQYYYVSPYGRRLFELALGQFTLAFVAVSDPESLTYIRGLREDFGDKWIEHYLRDKNISTKNLIKY